MNNKQTIWDVIVIGGGPAGMMAASIAGEKHKKVLLLEKNDSLGKKLRITGGGRCNITNAEEDTRTFLSHYKQAAPFLFSPFSLFNQQDTISFFKELGVETKVEDRKRVFPKTDSAETVFNSLITLLEKRKVEIKTKAQVKKVVSNGSHIESVILDSGEKLEAKSFIIATGGKGRPDTGSTGDGFTWLSSLGHEIITPSSSLVPLRIKESFVKRLQGITLEQTKVSIFLNGKKQEIIKKETSAVKKTGRVLFTHFGISGPMILNLSKDIKELLNHGEVVVSLDLVPETAEDILQQELTSVFKKEHSKKIKNSLGEFGSSALIEEVLTQVSVPLDTICHHVSREMRLKLAYTLKHFNLTVAGLLEGEHAIVTSGGVSLKEVDFKTFKSKIVDNLFIVGDMLNIDRPSGGFSLQLCWTSGFIAGSNA